jgi:hypothetical protein
MNSNLDAGACVVRCYDSLALDGAAVRRALGLRAPPGNGARWESTIASLANLLPPLARGRAIIRIESVASLERRRLVLADGTTFEGAVGQFLAHSRLLALFVATIGSAVERLSRRWLRGGNVIAGLVADAIGSELAESAAFLCQREVRAWAGRRGMDITPRYSPGYCGMSVRQQGALFAELPVERVGVRLTPSFLMLPVKSVSGLIGIAPAGSVSPEDYPCSRCDHPSCMQRRADFDARRGSCVDWADCGIPLLVGEPGNGT